MRKKCLMITLAIILFVISLSNMISSSNVGLIESPQWQSNLTSSNYDNAAVFGDIDNDGDLDLVSIGCVTKPTVCTVADKSYVYINNGTAFVEDLTWEQNLSKIGYGSLALGDMDNDGDLDLILTGSWASTTQIYTNNGTTFTENSTLAPNISEEASSESVLLGDIDNDGDLDIVFAGMGPSNPPPIGTTGKVVYIYNGTSFIWDSTWSYEITEEDRISSALIDLDNDGDLDLNIMGTDSAKSYINNGTSFVYDAYWNTISADEGSIVWGDIDNDEDFDVVESRLSDNVILINNGSEFVDSTSLWDLDMTGYQWGSLAFGDYNNNGYLDLASIGVRSGIDYAQILSNNGSIFARDSIAESNITGQRYSSVLWGDVDNDNDLDLVIIRSQKVYINNITTPNSAPTPPTSFSSSYENRKIKLGWGNGSDAETSSLGLYYNLMVGNSSNNHTIISGVYGGYADQTGGGTTGGYFGNMMQRKNFTLKVDRLQPSTNYTWYVQTIDTALKAGNWSVMQSFTTPADMEKPSITLNTPVENYNSSSAVITFNATVTDANLTSVRFWGNWSGWHLNQTNSSGINGTYIFTKNLSGYGDGSYTWMIEARDNSTNLENSSIRTFTIDTTPPNITNETKSPSVVYTNNNSRLNATITDALVGVKSVWISINAAGNFINYSVNSSASIYSFLLDSGNYSKGNNVSWRYYANDSAGNLRTGNLQSFVIENSAPVLSGIPDNSTNEDTIPPDKFYNLSAYASDADNDNLTFYIQSQSNSSLINCSVYNISISYYLNCSTPASNASGNSIIVVNATDGTAWSNDTFIITVAAVNDIPWLTSVNLTAGANTTNETLYGSYVFNDVESSEARNETKWYRNGTEVTSLINFSSVSSGNTTKGENWTFSARAYDGSNWSKWQNSSVLTILNAAPDFSSIANQTWLMNSNLSLNLSLYFTDIDNDNLNFINTTVQNITISYNGSIVSLIPDTGWNGTRYVIFTANDSELAINSNNITLTVFKPVFNFSEFDGDTTNFTNLNNFINVSVIIEKASDGKINFSSVTLNETLININNFVNISFNRIEVNGSALPSLNRQATLYLYNLTFSNPRVLKDGNACSSSECPEISYSGGTFVFNVSSFSVYSSDETPSTGGATSGGGGSGGGTAVTGKTYVVTDEQVKEGYSQTLSANDKIKFSINNVSHLLTVNNVSLNYVNLTLSSAVVNFLIYINEEEKFELTNDDYYDLSIKLNGIENNKANLTIKAIYEEIKAVEPKKAEEGKEEEAGKETEEEEEETEEGLTKKKIEFWLWIIAVIGLIIVLIYFILKKYAKYKEWKKWTLLR